MPDPSSDRLASGTYTPTEQARKVAKIRHERRARWEQKLYALMHEMDTANGEHGDDVEALVRVAWKMLYEERQQAEKAVF